MQLVGNIFVALLLPVFCERASYSVSILVFVVCEFLMFTRKTQALYNTHLVTTGIGTSECRGSIPYVLLAQIGGSRVVNAMPLCSVKPTTGSVQIVYVSGIGM